MNILYIGRHNQPNNDDEGAVAWSLRRLGHSVTEIEESQDIYEINTYLVSVGFSTLYIKVGIIMINILTRYTQCVDFYF